MNKSDVRLPEQPGNREKANGAAETHQKRGAGRARPVEMADSSAPEQRLALFSQLTPAAVDAPAWPVHLAMWLEPACATPLPENSGLRVERRHKIPSRGFLGLVNPAPGAPAPIKECRPVVPDLRLPLPASGLKPAGWEPRRAFVRRQGPGHAEACPTGGAR
jgi:hypothetical protein